MDRLFLIDGMSLVFRAYHAMQRSGLKNSKGEPTFAIFAFINIITNLLEKENPKNIAVVFDRAEPTFRHLMFEQYKANRAAFPEDLAPQLPKIKEFIDLISIPQFELAGYEADDIIGTIAKDASDNKIHVACLTSDKDYYQLVNEYVQLYKPNPKGDENFDIVDINGVYNKFGVTPDKVIDVLALIGDTSDNIPGVKGIGEKTAIPLVQEFGSIEDIYQNIENISKPAVRSKLEADKKNAELAKILVTIKTDVPIGFSIEDLKQGTPDYKKLDEFFEYVGFNTLRKKWAEKGLKDGVNVINSNVEPPANSSTVDNTTHNYFHVKNEELLNMMLEDISGKKILSVDLETSSLDKQNCEIVGIALCGEPGKAYYVSVYTDFNLSDIPKVTKERTNGDSLFGDDNIDNDRDEAEIPSFQSDLLPLSYALQKIRPLLEDPQIGKIGQNIKFDAYILGRFDVNLSPIVFDSMIASYLLNPDEQHNMDALSQKWLNYIPIPITSLIGEKKSEQKSMKDIDPALIADYAAEDADIAYRLFKKLHPQLVNENLAKLADEIEFPLIEVLTKMEARGIALNTKMLDELSVKIAEELKQLSKQIINEAGQDFNIDSPKQLGEILFEKMMLPPVSKTKTGYSTNVTVLEQLAPFHPIAEYALEYRQLKKLSTTYIDALPKLINPKTNRIHTTYNQTIASTGRLSSTDPNLQNIPIRTKLGKEIRSAFVPGSANSVILSADYSQIELRIMAHISNDHKLIDSFKNGLDIHSATAAILFDKQIDAVDSDMRRVAKTVNFGIMYGLGSFGLSQRLGMSRKEAKEIIDNYFDKYPGIRKYIDMTIKFAETNGYAETLLGRRRYFPNINARNRNLKTADERAAINLPIQGTASDMLKIAMIRVDKAMQSKNMKSLMMLQVHDELVFEAFNDELDELRKLVIYEMENALLLGDVPVVVDTGIGKNWLEAH